jgi:glycosyltransferase involved in cell wall biosynthesis
MCREMTRTGHEATLVCPAGSEKRVMARARGQGVERIETMTLRTGLRPGADARDLRALGRRMAAVDIVHVHRSKEHWLAALANRLSSNPRPLIRTRHIVQAIRPHPLNRWLYARATDLVVTVTEAIRRQCVGAGLAPGNRVVTLPGAADGERFRAAEGGPLRNELGVPEGVPLVGLLSGFRVMKGHAIVVDAVETLARSGRLFHLVFAGSGPFEASVREQVSRAGLADRVSFLGFVDDPSRIVRSLDIALYPPLESDGMSRALFEYMASGRAVIASRVGAAAEVLSDGETALLVPGGDAPELARALERLLGDSVLRRGLGQNAAALAHERYTGARVAERLVEHYQKLAAPS